MESDYHQFDFALIGGSLERHLQCMALPYLRAITNEGIWRLYQIVPDVMVEQHRSALN